MTAEATTPGERAPASAGVDDKPEQPPGVKVVELKIYQGGRDDRGGPPGGAGDGGDDDIAPVFGSDDYLAARLTASLGDDWRCAAGEWYHWDGRRWDREQTRLVWDRSRRICRAVAGGLENQSLSRKIGSKPAIYAAVSLAEADRTAAMLVADFDRDPWKLNTPDGIVDLRSGQLEPHDRAALMTKIANAGPAGGQADCPIFKRYLAEATGGDLPLQQYLQRVSGYCLTGSNEEHCIFFFHGGGGTGKTTFLLGMQDLLGDYAVNSPMNAFTVSAAERHPTELAHFAGARIVCASEVEEGMRWDEAKLKAISGGDTITARFMRGDFFQFEPQFKLLLAGNHRPRMRSGDDAMRRRMQVIPFRHKPQAVDKQLREKLREELPAILRWAIEGEAERRQLGGLMPPAVVIEATDEYFKQENTLGRWIDERCETAPTYWAETRELYRDFEQWARGVGEYVIAERVFSEKLEMLPLIEKALHTRTRRSGFRGVRLYGATPELPLDLGARDDPRVTAAPIPVRANDLPIVNIGDDDPAERWDRD